MSGGIVGGLSSGIELLLHILENPERLKLELERITKAADEANEAIALAGAAHEVLAMRDRLKRELEDAETARADLERRRSTVLQTAKKEADDGILAASQRAAEMRAEAERVLEEARGRMAAAVSERKTVDELRRQAEKELRELDRACVAAEQARAAHEAQSAALAAEQERLRLAREKLVEALG